MKNKIFIVFSLLLLLFSEVNADNYVPYRVIFVHGIGSKTGTWDSTRTNLKNIYEKFYPSGNPNNRDDEGTYYFPMFDYESRNNGDITKIASLDLGDTVGDKSLKTKINEAISIYQSISGKPEAECKVILVCHSMGGLVARALLKKDETGDFPTVPVGYTPGYYKSHIDKIIFIGSPHKGSPLASALWLVKKEKVKLDQKIREISDEIGIGPDLNNLATQALIDLKDNLYATFLTTNEILDWAKYPVTPVIGTQLDFTLDAE